MTKSASLGSSTLTSFVDNLVVTSDSLSDERPVLQREAQRDPVEVEALDRVLQSWVCEGTFEILPAKCYRIVIHPNNKQTPTCDYSMCTDGPNWKSHATLAVWQHLKMLIPDF
jgi:hypothetical protein